MADVDETYSRPRNRKPEYDNGKKIPVKNQDKDIGNSNFQFYISPLDGNHLNDS